MHATPDPEKSICVEATAYHQLLDALPLIIYAVDSTSNRILYGNEFFRKRHPGWRATPCHALVNGLDMPCPHCRRGELFDAAGNPLEQSLEYEFFNEFDDHWYQIQERALIWENGRPVHFIIAVDISDLKETQNQLAEAHAALVLKHQELEHIACTDSLTQIYNRSQLSRIFDKELKLVQLGTDNFSIISVDIDHFKSVNDSFGHAVGDQILIAVARIMKNSIRSTDYIGRWGGEEFLILCPQTSLSDAVRLADRIRQAVAAGEYATGKAHTISIGAATYSAEDTLDSLLHRADLAMYRAKEQGRNRVCSEEM
ncbi:hypothetical protein MASR1M90_17160 [Desulfovibrionales bacterium]